MSYRLELLVTDEGKPFYPAVGSLVRPSKENAGYDLKVVVDQTPLNEA